jgi:hypothetical protein
MTIETEIRAYLKALEASKAPQPRGRRTVEYLQRKIDAVPAEMEAASDPLKKVKLAQERLELQAELESRTAVQELDKLEAVFVENAAQMSLEHGLSYAAWRDVGVPSQVLSKAGIKRGSVIAVKDPASAQQAGSEAADAVPAPAPEVVPEVAGEPWPDPDPAQHSHRPELPPYPA